MTIYSRNGLTIGFQQPLFNTGPFEFAPGQIVGVIGANGTGKTAFLKTLSGLMPPIDGDLKQPVFISWKPTHLPEYCPFLGRDILTLHPGSVRQLPGTDIARVCAHLELSDFLDRPFYRLSHGEQHRVMIARMFCADYPVKVFDEPLNGLDPRQRQRFTELVVQDAKQDGLIITSGHNLEWHRHICDTTTVILNGVLNTLEESWDIQSVMSNYFA